jgi:hypothetical protein
LCVRSEGFSDDDLAAIAREIDIYNGLRDTLSVAAAALLTDQAAASGGPEWDVLQETASDNAQSLVCAYQSDEGATKITVKPTALIPDANYRVESVDTGMLGVATGADIMANGIDLVGSPASAAHILLLRVE